MCNPPFLTHPISSNPLQIVMKIQFLSLCLLFLFISAISAQEDVVLDIEGNPLQEGSKYYVVSSIRGAGGGGLTLSKYSNGDCPLTVSQEGLDLFRGIPCTFHPATTSADGLIHLSSSLNVKFADEFMPSCANSTVWKVGHLDAWLRTNVIVIEGEKGNPGCATSGNWFKIEKGWSSISYKFVFNPVDVCSDSVSFSNDLAIEHPPSGGRPLVLSFGLPAFNVVFVKYDGNAIRNKVDYATQ